MPQQTDGWPENVKPISFEAIKRMGVGPGNRLYWDGKPVRLSRRLDLSAVERAIAIVVAVATVSGAAAAGVQAWVALQQLHAPPAATPQGATR